MTLVACDASDKYQKWGGSALEEGSSGGDVVNQGAKTCLEAINVDPVQSATCVPNPGSAGFTYANRTIEVGPPASRPTAGGGASIAPRRSRAA